ncbi:LUD domain-containing protein [Arcobacter sp. 15-2]|uniref:LutC/YkgG family protein n=1 Tax=Arcobacter sp. 15-2 TaxID=3374109 RepID=UPI00399CD086
MTSKQLILDKIRKNNIVPKSDLPEYTNFGLTFENKFEEFSRVLNTVGGDAIDTTKDKLDEVISSLYPDEKVIVSNIEESKLGNFIANDESDPHNLRDVDLAIVKGEFAVAENGAVWLKNSDNRHRSLYFIAQNIIIVVKKSDILNNMHEAYEKISFEDKGYGVFVSGPSKTADIEQSLVIGAHGPKSGYVIFID